MPKSPLCSSMAYLLMAVIASGAVGCFMLTPIYGEPRNDYSFSGRVVSGDGITPIRGIRVNLAETMGSLSTKDVWVKYLPLDAASTDAEGYFHGVWRTGPALPPETKAMYVFVEDATCWNIYRVKFKKVDRHDFEGREVEYEIVLPPIAVGRDQPVATVDRTP